MTINPLEANEVTLPLPESPKNNYNSNYRPATHEIPHSGGFADLNSYVNVNNSRRSSCSSRSRNNYSSYGGGHRSIANTTIIVDDDGNENIQGSFEDSCRGTDRMLGVDGYGSLDDDEDRR